MQYSVSQLIYTIKQEHNRLFINYHVVPDVNLSLSNTTVFVHPFSARWCAALTPATPPPTTTQRAAAGSDRPTAPTEAMTALDAGSRHLHSAARCQILRILFCSDVDRIVQRNLGPARRRAGCCTPEAVVFAVRVTSKSCIDTGTDAV